MRNVIRAHTALLLSLLLLLPVGSTFAASPRATAHRHAPRLTSVTIAITTTGTVWGKVTARYTLTGRTIRRSCSAASCTLRVPRGAMLHLAQSPTNSATWPFKDWKVTVKHRTRTMLSKAISVRATGTVTVHAVYVVAGSPSSGSGSGNGSNWP